MNQKFSNENARNPKVKKKLGGIDIAATIISAALFFLFGILGALICYIGYWVVRSIAKSNLPLVARIILGTVVALIFVGLLIAFLLFAANLRASIGV